MKKVLVVVAIMAAGYGLKSLRDDQLRNSKTFDPEALASAKVGYIASCRKEGKTQLFCECVADGIPKVMSPADLFDAAAAHRSGTAPPGEFTRKANGLGAACESAFGR